MPKYKKVFKSSEKKVIKEAVKKAVEKASTDKYSEMDYALVNPISGTAGTSYLISYGADMTQGDGVHNRTADKYRIKNIDLRYTLAGTDAVHNTNVRVAIILHKLVRGVAPSPADFMTQSAGRGICRPFYPTHQTKDKLIVLSDVVHHIPATGNITADVNQMTFKKNVKVDRVVQCVRGSNTGNIADVESYAVYVWMWCAQDVASSTSRAQCLDLQAIINFEDA